MSSTISNTLEEESGKKKKKRNIGQICANIYSSFTDLHYWSKNKNNLRNALLKLQGFQ